MKETFKANLCKCNNCDLILVDKNPQVDAIEHSVFLNTNKQWVNKDGIEVAEMQFLDGDDESFWGCPICETDDYLTDMTVESKRAEITASVIDIFDRIGIETPSNLEDITQFVFEDVCDTADGDDWNNDDVAIGFRRWIESHDKNPA